MNAIEPAAIYASLFGRQAASLTIMRKFRGSFSAAYHDNAQYLGNR